MIGALEATELMSDALEAMYLMPRAQDQWQKSYLRIKGNCVWRELLRARIVSHIVMGVCCVD